MLPGTRVRPVQMRVQHGAHAALDRLDRPGQQVVELRHRARPSGPQVPAGGRLRDAGVVGRRRERNVEVRVAGFRAEAVRVDEEEGAFRRVPACGASVGCPWGFSWFERGKGRERRAGRLTLVVEHDGQHGQLVPLADPVHAPGHAEEEGPVADDVAYKSLPAHGKLDS